MRLGDGVAEPTSKESNHESNSSTGSRRAGGDGTRRGSASTTKPVGSFGEGLGGGREFDRRPFPGWKAENAATVHPRAGRRGGGHRRGSTSEDFEGGRPSGVERNVQIVCRICCGGGGASRARSGLGERRASGGGHDPRLDRALSGERHLQAESWRYRIGARGRRWSGAAPGAVAARRRSAGDRYGIERRESGTGAGSGRGRGHRIHAAGF